MVKVICIAVIGVGSFVGVQGSLVPRTLKDDSSVARKTHKCLERSWSDSHLSYPRKRQEERCIERTNKYNETVASLELKRTKLLMENASIKNEIVASLEQEYTKLLVDNESIKHANEMLMQTIRKVSELNLLQYQEVVVLAALKDQDNEILKAEVNNLSGQLGFAERQLNSAQDEIGTLEKEVENLSDELDAERDHVLDVNVFAMQIDVNVVNFNGPEH